MCKLHFHKVEWTSPKDIFSLKLFYEDILAKGRFYKNLLSIKLHKRFPLDSVAFCKSSANTSMVEVIFSKVTAASNLANDEIRHGCQMTLFAKSTKGL